MPARHTPPGDVSFRTSLLRNLAGGAVLVLLVAAVFLGIGSITGPEAPEVAGTPGDDPDAEATPEPEAAAVDEDDEAGPEPDEADEEPGGDAEEPDESDEAAESDEAEASDEAEEPDEAEEAAEPDEPGRIDPGDITVQVLDGVGTDGGAAANRVADEVRDAGYRLIAQNPAIAYDVTTVLWTSGNEDRARQVAADIGASEVREQPGNLSEQVDVHVVVGSDRA